MEKIKTVDDFENLMSLEKSIAFIFFEWSGQALVSKQTVTEWNSQIQLKTPLFEINPEDLKELDTWINANNVHGHGYGALVWLKKGKIIDFKQNAGEFGITEIERKTSEIFRQ